MTTILRPRRPTNRRRQPQNHSRYRCLAMGMILVTVVTSIANSTSDLNSDNARVRRAAIIDAANTNNANCTAIFHQGLADHSPIVVEETVKQIGRLRLPDEAARLVTLYADADQRFGAYGERVAFAIITALGELGGPIARDFLIEQLCVDNGSVLGEHLLLACGKTSDAALIPAIKRYSDKMTVLIKKAKVNSLDPMIWSMIQRYVNLAAEVEQSLTIKGGK
jgi:hypothetical protein